MTLYKGYLADTGIRSDGLGWWMQTGTGLIVDGTQMVEIGHAILNESGWHSDRCDALLDVARQVEQLGHRLLAQADTLRADAAKEAARKAVVTT